jgi:hypothetical protein
MCIHTYIHACIQDIHTYTANRVLVCFRDCECTGIMHTSNTSTHTGCRHDIYIYIYTYTYIYVCVYVCMYVCMYNT